MGQTNTGFSTCSTEILCTLCMGACTHQGCLGTEARPQVLGQNTASADEHSLTTQGALFFALSHTCFPIIYSTWLCPQPTFSMLCPHDTHVIPLPALVHLLSHKHPKHPPGSPEEMQPLLAPEPLTASWAEPQAMTSSAMTFSVLGAPRGIGL